MRQIPLADFNISFWIVATESYWFLRHLVVEQLSQLFVSQKLKFYVEQLSQLLGKFFEPLGQLFYLFHFCLNYLTSIVTLSSWPVNANGVSYA